MGKFLLFYMKYMRVTHKNPWKHFYKKFMVFRFFHEFYLPSNSRQKQFQSRIEEIVAKSVEYDGLMMVFFHC